MNIIKILLLLLLSNKNIYLLKTVFHNIHKSSRHIDMMAIEKNDNETYLSFNEFIEERNKRQEKMVIEYFKKAEEKEKKMRRKMEKYNNIKPRSKYLRLVSYLETIEWSKQWIHDMINYGSSKIYPGFIYEDIFEMREFCKKNISNEYFYIGYYPEDVNTYKGPYYIGAFGLNISNRDFNTYLIIQNPNYIIASKKDNDRFKNFKKELKKMTEDAFVFFQFSELKNKSSNRYYLSWLLEDCI